VPGKFVFSRAFLYPSERKEVPSVFLRLLDALPSAFVFMVNHPRYGMWMGATPETFLSASNGTLKTQALAGTRKAGTSGAWGKKEVEEQEYVAAHIRENLRKADVVFREAATATIKAGPVEHLLTRFEITTFNRTTVEMLVSNLHPTPAVCGTPTPAAMSLIRELEPIPRGYYTGFLGPVFSPKEFKLYVNLRSMQVFSNALALRLGGGITKDSVIEHEWEETLLKAQTLLGVLK
jgi:isochorismate synthase